MDWTDLDPDKRLTYLIGDIVRSDVFLEWEARGVFRIVSQVSARPPEREHRDLAPLLDSIKDSLRGLVVDEFATEMARHAVIEAAAAHKQRSGPVHDYWMHQGGADERWVSVQAIAKAPAVEATARNIEVFVQCRDAMLHAAWRMRAVGLVLPMWVGLPSSVEHLGDDEVRWWTAAAHGLFRTPSGPGLLDVEKNHSFPLPPRRERDRRRDRLDTEPMSGNS